MQEFLFDPLRRGVASSRRDYNNLADPDSRILTTLPVCIWPLHQHVADDELLVFRDLHVVHRKMDRDICKILVAPAAVTENRIALDAHGARAFEIVW